MVKIKRSKLIIMLSALALLALPACAASAAEPEPTGEPTAAPTATPEPTAAEDMPYTLRWQGGEYTGLYTGAIRGGLPEGAGVFTGASASRNTLTWDGGWLAGEPAGAGALAASRYVTACEGEDTAGTYAGAGLDGAAEGAGEFTAVTADGVPFTYTGAWSGGAMDGQGALTYVAENRYVRAGTFTAGRWTPTWTEALAALGTREPAFALTEAQLAFLTARPDLWEREDHQAFFESPYQAEHDRQLTLYQCVNDPDTMAEPRWACLYSLRTVRSHVVTLGGHDFTCILAGADGTYNIVVQMIVPGRLEEMSQGRRFHAYALPVSLSEYTTVLGERQPCVVLLAGDVYLGQP